MILNSFLLTLHRFECGKDNLVDDTAFLGDVLGVVFIHNVFERGKIVLALVTIYAIGNGYQPYIMERKELFRQLADLNVVTAQPGKVFHKHSRDIPSLNSRQHFLKAGTLHRRARDTVIYKENSIGVALFLGGLLKYFLLVANAVGLTIHVVIAAQAAI